MIEAFFVIAIPVGLILGFWISKHNKKLADIL